MSPEQDIHAMNTADDAMLEAPPAGEDIHLPPGTPIPLLLALGITMALVGTTTSWLWTYIGSAIFLLALGLWIRDTIHEVNHLPDEHVVPAGSGAASHSSSARH